MGKAVRIREERARASIAAQRAAAQRAETRRKLLIAGGAMLAVIAVVVALVVIKSLKTSPAAAAAAAKAESTVAREITSVPASVLNAVGGGPSASVSPLTPATGSSALTSGGKPQVLYMGAEYCPYCAAERWSIVTALSRFGTFSGLRFIRSTANDVYSNTATLTFYKSAYQSNYITFTPVEMFNGNGNTASDVLQKATNAQQALLTKYSQGSFPFVDVGGSYIVSGAQYLPSYLGTLASQSATHFGLTWQQIGQDLQNPNNTVAQHVLGAANYMTAAICKLTNGKPGNVCNSPAITKLGGKI